MTIQQMLLGGSGVELIPATWDPSYDNTTYPEAILTESDLLATGNVANYCIAVSSIVIPKTGKWRVQAELVGTPNTSIFIGVANEDTYNTGNFPGQTADTVGYRASSGDKRISDSNSAYGSSYGDGDIVDLLIDSDNQKLYFAKNGTIQNSGDPDAGTGYATNALAATKDLYIFATAWDAIGWRINCGQSAWAYSLDSNYIGLGS